jgi:hypothetical protein
MKIIPTKYFGSADEKAMHSLLDPDNEGPWAVRYLWIQHLKDNDVFYDNYFTEGNQTGYNVRKQTTHLQNHWNYHNQIFHDSEKNGNLIWRVKVGNQFSKSIDYIEIWKSKEILIRYFGGTDANIDEKTIWENSEKEKFAENLYNNGFDIRYWYPYSLISKECAMRYYKLFVERWKARDRCIINTVWNKNLNPVE